MDAGTLRIEARKLAAEIWYRGVQGAVIAGMYDDLDVVKLAEASILRGMELATHPAIPDISAAKTEF